MTRSRRMLMGTQKVSFLEAGRRGRQAIILLHGSGLDHAAFCWKYTIPALKHGYHVIAPDLPGYGATTCFEGPYTVQEVGRWLIRFLDHLGIERAHLVGLSMGGAVALWVAINHPDRVHQVVPVASYGLQKRLAFHASAHYLSRLPITRAMNWLIAKSAKFTIWTLRGVFSNPARADERVIDELRQVARRPQSHRSFQLFQCGEIGRTGLATCLLPHLSRIQSRVLFIHGIDDQLIALENIERAVSRMPNASLVKLKAGHWPTREVPELFTRVLTRYFRTGIARRTADAARDRVKPTGTMRVTPLSPA